MALDFPVNPTVGQVYAAEGGVWAWVWNGTRWAARDTTGIAGITASSAQPASPKEGQFWYRTAEPKGLYMWSGGSWTEVSDSDSGEGDTFVVQNFATRAEFVAANLVIEGMGFVDGQTVTAGGLSYIRKAGATAIPDLLGFVPANISTPQHFGAVPDGVTDCSSAISSWFSAAMAAGLTDLYVPAGKYRMLSRVSKTATDFYFHLRGDGRGVSTFLVDNPNGGLQFTATARYSAVTVSDISFIAVRAGAGTAFAFNMPVGGVRHSRSIILRHMEARGSNVNVDYFNVALNLTGNWRPFVFDVQTCGVFGPAVNDDKTDASPVYFSTCGLVIDYCYDALVESSHFWAAYTGISSIGDNQEGFKLLTVVINGCRVALDFKRTGREPTVKVDNCHWNYRDVGLRFDGAKLICIRASHPYNEDYTSIAATTAYDIHLANCEHTLITDNIFHAAGNPDRVNIFADSTVNSTDLNIIGNSFNSTTVAAIRVGAGALRTYIADNTYPGANTKQVDDLSGKATIVGPGGLGEYVVEYQDDAAGGGPTLRLFRPSESPAVNDTIGSVRYNDKNDVDAEISYALARSTIRSPVAGAEAADLQMWVTLAGALSRQLTVGNGVTTGAAVAKGPGTLNVETTFWINGKQVILGAADSAGAGYRTMSIQN